MGEELTFNDSNHGFLSSAQIKQKLEKKVNNRRRHTCIGVLIGMYCLHHGCHLQSSSLCLNSAY